MTGTQTRTRRPAQGQWVCAKSHGGCGWHHPRTTATCPWCAPRQGPTGPKGRPERNKTLTAAGAAADERRTAQKNAARSARRTDRREPSVTACSDVPDDLSDGDHDGEQFPGAPWATMGRKGKVSFQGPERNEPRPPRQRVRVT